MNLETRLKRDVSVIVCVLAIFWGSLSWVNPNPLFRIIFFSCAFGSTAYWICHGYVHWIINRTPISERTKK